MEAALCACEERFHSVTQSANEAIIVADGQGEIVSWNRGAEEIFGYEEQEVLGRPLTALMPERYRDAHLNGLGRFRSTGVAKVVGKAIELHGLRKDGSEIPVELSLAMWKTGASMFFSGIIRDITARRQAEDALRESEERFRSLAASAPIGIFCADAQGHCVYNNPRWQAITGLSLEESPGTGWTRAVHPEDRQAVVDYWTLCAQLGSAFYREFRVQKTSGEVRWVYSLATAIQSGGNVVGYVGTVEDITDRREAEAEREALIRLLNAALAEVKNLGGLLPICAGCKKIRDDNGYWNQIEN